MSPPIKPLRKLIVTADLGHLKAFVVSTGPGKNELAPVENLSLNGGFDPTDREGRFPGGEWASSRCGISLGEPHGRAQEVERRQIRELAAQIDEVVTRYRCELWNLAVPAGINRRVVAALSLPVRERLTINLQADLVGLGDHEVYERFSPGV